MPWLLALVVLVLVVLVARAGATPATDLARDYANAITGVDADEADEPAGRPGTRISAQADTSEDGEDDEPGGASDLDELGAAGDLGGLDVLAADELAGDDAADASTRRTLADHAGERALDGGLASPALTSDELGDTRPALTSEEPGDTSPIAGAVERAEARLRRRRLSLLGRFDIAVAWRHRNRAPIHSPAYQAEELWLLATWRR